VLLFFDSLGTGGAVFREVTTLSPVSVDELVVLQWGCLLGVLADLSLGADSIAPSKGVIGLGETILRAPVAVVSSLVWQITPPDAILFS